MSYKGKRVLVTGGAGFIGSNVVRRLLNEGARVCVLDDLFTGKIKNLPTHPRLRFIQGSVTNCKLVEKLVCASEFVFHLAARNTKFPEKDFAVNIGGTLQVLRAAREARKLQRIVYASSASIYGNSSQFPIHENMPAITLSPYAVSKCAGENYCTAFNRTFGIPTVSLRYSNVYGPGQDSANPYCGVMSKFISGIEQNNAITIFGDGKQTRDFTYIDDVVEATLRAGVSSQAIGEVFNVSTGIETSIRSIAVIFKKMYTKPFAINFAAKRDIDSIRRRVLSSKRIQARLHWSARTDLTEGLRNTIAWFKAFYAPNH